MWLDSDDLTTMHQGWGAHSSLHDDYAVNGFLHWIGNSSWWIIETIESYNGARYLSLRELARSRS
ncbi:MAG: hypothetical protein MUF81_04245 [Verrucomicrobia bacterium]|nr:hypothetical protein [Verrucomicrobiota bacterium]